MELFNHRDKEGHHYRVCRAGASLRLYTNGIFHTQHHPTRDFDGSLWDLLWLPSIVLANQAVRRILVLGVGGGAVICALRKRYPQALIIGVDINAVHLTIARRFFRADGPNTLLLEADALAFMEFYRGPAFDLIIDDLFASENGEPSRVVALTPKWSHRLSRALSSPGLLLVNFTAVSEFRAAWQVLLDGSTPFAATLEWSHKRYDNRIGAFYRQAYVADWQDRLCSFMPSAIGENIYVRAL
ncbi:methyltransferase domain-containing protein [Gilvimarinus polysaccharolyticus]|uniref:methyltransferase domain-containing protein n=1 Tax=Gilvimarinus polysaccharolyticus TaxID=863921 RepID=UPI00067327D7|nr:class I SAM-dependent methyltransferase [Gilvimarinus polysaccharolyticus]